MKKIFVLICCIFLFFSVFSQSKNTSVEVLDYRTVDGKIVLELLVNDIKADFVLDINGANAVLPEYVEKLKIDQEVQKSLSNVTKTRGIEVIKTMKINKISFGNNIFRNGFPVLVLKDAPYLRKLGVAGTINARFTKSVLFKIPIFLSQGTHFKAYLSCEILPTIISLPQYGQFIIPSPINSNLQSHKMGVVVSIIHYSL